MMRKKSQAALEFLMTYGWAILVVLIAIAALAYFGILNPTKFAPKSCILGPGLACLDFKVNQDGTASLVVQNGLGKDLINASLEMEGCNSTTGKVATFADGSTQTFNFNQCPVSSKGQRFKAKLYFNYTDPDSGMLHTIVGEIKTVVE